MDRGYVKLWRKTLDSGWLKNHKLFVFWSYCLLKATHKPIDILVGSQQVHLEPGQFVFGRMKAANDCGMSEREIRTCVGKLNTFENMTIKTTNKFSIITIVNWDIYQQEENEKDQQNDQVATSKRPASDHKQTHKHINTKEINIYNVDFEKFWKEYPSKVGKGAAWSAWKKNGRPEIGIILEAIDNQKKSRKWIEGYIPNPATWINQKRWLDETAEHEKPSRWFGNIKE